MAGTRFITGSRHIDPACHAEIGCIKKVVRFAKKGVLKGTIVSIRVTIDSNGSAPTLLCGKPCLSCTHTMTKFGVKQCIYTDYHGSIVKEKMSVIAKSATLSSGYTNRITSTITSLTIRDKAYLSIASGRKTIEGRVLKGYIRTIRVGCRLMIKSNIGSVYKTVRKIRRFRDFRSMLRKLDAEGRLDDVLPNLSVSDGVKHYRKIYKTIPDEGVIAIYFSS